MDAGVGWRADQYRPDLVLSNGEPQHAYLDDNPTCCATRIDDLSSSGHGQSIPGRGQREPEPLERVYEQLMKPGA